MRIPISIAYAFLALAIPSGFAQMSRNMPTGTVHFDGNGNFVTATFTIKVPLQVPQTGFLPGRPYSAEEISQQTQILPDGTKILRSGQSNFMYRDSAGRTRAERHMPAPATGKHADVPAVPEIFDPFSGCIYYLDVANGVAHRVTVPQPIRALTPPQGLVFPGAAPVMSTVPGTSPSITPERSSESLGTQVIEGVLAQGTRTTTTYPVGAMGNDQPISATTENWISRDLNAVVLSKISDPRQGDRIQALVNISQTEPDPALFQVPPGYQVIDETGPFTITIKGSSKGN
jgi:hypothetical protein